MKGLRRLNINLIHRYLIRLAKRISEPRLMIIVSIIIGIVSAFAALMFEAAVDSVRIGLTSVVDVESVNFLFLITPLVGIILVTIFVKYIIKDNISHGVTKILYALTHSRSNLKAHNTYSSIVAGATTIGFGGSVGPEAPIVMTGAAVGSNIAKIFRMDYRNSTILLGCGTAAALAGIFKAPIAGVVFVIEVLLLNINISSIVPILIAAATSTTITYFWHGFTPIFDIEATLMAFTVGDMPYYVVLAAMCGLASIYLIQTSARIEAYFKKIDNQWKKWAVGGTALGVLIFLLPPLYGQGYNSIINIVSGDTDALFNNSLLYSLKDNVWVLLGFLLAIMAFKSIAMACTNAAGGVGGAFAPSLFLGAFTGYFTAIFLNTVFGLNLPPVSFVLVGMAGVMSGAMDSPLTAMFLIAEISGGYKLFVPLMMVSAVAFGMSYYFAPYSVYTRELVMKGDTLSLAKERSLFFIEIQRLVEDDFVKINPTMTLGALIDIVSKSKRNLFPVINSSGRLIGVVTLDDIRHDMFNHDLYGINTVADYMTPPPAVIYINDPIGEMLTKFDESKAWNLPVKNEDGRYMGFISKSKIFSEYRNELNKD